MSRASDLRRRRRSQEYVGDVGDGVGIGLALAKRFVEFHSGSIKTSSKLGVGTTVEFIIPCSAPAEGGSGGA